MEETAGQRARQLADRLHRGERAAVAEALNLTDDRRPAEQQAALELLDLLEREARRPGAPRIGLTGAPGAGKSTLLDALVRSYRARGERIGIIAVDPSSQGSGGALLGDRIRVRSAAADEGVFIRSMAARERLGGLSDATRAGVIILAAAFDRVFVETVGVGQSEGEIASVADTLVFVATPGSGDELQFMKAGVIELPDVFVVNKADTGQAAERTAQELLAGVSLGTSAPSPPVVLTSARDGLGVDALVNALDTHWSRLQDGGGLDRRRRDGRDHFAITSLERRFGSFGLDALGGRHAVVARLEASPDGSGFGLLAALGEEIERALASGGSPS